ncbi:hypothetical protein BHU72_12230 [Desulfuribacillus stibiiarsenatis]|uniref:PhnB-like domain-containing protein n=1 Tax=Desulfuribacillus stibiiarsenatis TaxID=1390249 RepID=A0A1E5L1Y9_9FIRM|nr:VOC family protein [Desulfuribacillus stibiiarsenatis]OEH84168.1 hypothetical protein BHU72_12230 [Desulfuribacillus stibiiarsenatis]
MSNWIIPYISFNGNCAEAVKFYQSILGGESQILRFGDVPPNPKFPPVPEDMKNLVMHAELRKNGHIIRFSDTLPHAPSTLGNAISFSIECANQEETKTVFAGLAAGGSVDMELEPTFFSPLYGRCIDKFGITWQVATKP